MPSQQLKPKQAFLSKKETASDHRDRVVNSNFRAAVESAFLQLIMDCQAPKTPDEAVAIANRIIGAREAVSAMLNIAELPENTTGQVTLRTPPNLIH